MIMLGSKESSVSCSPTQAYKVLTLFSSTGCIPVTPVPGPDTECEWWLMALTPVLLLVWVSLLLQLARLSVELLLLREPRLLRAVVLVS